MAAGEKLPPAPNFRFSTGKVYWLSGKLRKVLSCWNAARQVVARINWTNASVASRARSSAMAVLPELHHPLLDLGIGARALRRHVALEADDLHSRRLDLLRVVLGVPLLVSVAALG